MYTGILRRFRDAVSSKRPPKWKAKCFSFATMFQHTGRCWSWISPYVPNNSPHQNCYSRSCSTHQNHIFCPLNVYPFRSNVGTRITEQIEVHRNATRNHQPEGHNLSYYTENCLQRLRKITEILPLLPHEKFFFYFVKNTKMKRGYQ